MKLSIWLPATVAGIVIGASLVVACSDDSPGEVDAAVCDCPAAEPPLTGRITSVRSANPINAGAGGAAGASCPVGATLLGGACEIATEDANVLLSYTRVLRPGGNASYECHWSAINATAANTGTAEAICLVPAP